VIRRLILGCGCVTLLVLVAGGFLAWRMVVEPARDALAELEGLADLDAQLPGRGNDGASATDEPAYEAPADGELSASQVEGFVAVRRLVAAELETRVDELTREDGEPPIRVGGSGEAVEVDWTALKERAGQWRALVDDARTLQRQAAQEQGLAPAEYRWVRREVYRALGADVADLGVTELIALLRQGEVPIEVDPEAARELAPEANRELVEPYAAELRETLPLMLLGI
jgi:hypothetical protein